MEIVDITKHTTKLYRRALWQFMLHSCDEPFGQLALPINLGPMPYLCCQHLDARCILSFNWPFVVDLTMRVSLPQTHGLWKIELILTHSGLKLTEAFLSVLFWSSLLLSSQLEFDFLWWLPICMQDLFGKMCSWWMKCYMRLLSLIILWRFFFSNYVTLWLVLILPASVPHSLGLYTIPDDFQLKDVCSALISPLWSQAAKVAVKQYVASTFSHLLHDISGFLFH